MPTNAVTLPIPITSYYGNDVPNVGPLIDVLDALSLPIEWDNSTNITWDDGSIIYWDRSVAADRFVNVNYPSTQYYGNDVPSLGTSVNVTDIFSLPIEWDNSTNITWDDGSIIYWDRFVSPDKYIVAAYPLTQYEGSA